MAKRVGRPKLPKKQYRGSVVTVRLQKQERKAVGDAAKRSGLKVSEWVRSTLLVAAGAVTITEPNTEDAGIEPHGGTGRGLGV